MRANNLTVASDVFFTVQVEMSIQALKLRIALAAKKKASQFEPDWLCFIPRCSRGEWWLAQQ